MSEFVPLVSQALEHAGTALAHVSEKAAPKIVAHFVNKLSDQVIYRLFGSDVQGRISAIETAQARMDRCYQAFSDRLEAVERILPTTEILDDPAFIAFTQACLASAAQTANEGKQVLLGDLIADRLCCDTETYEELTLRQAQRVVADCNAPQLTALVRIMLVTAPPVTFCKPMSFAEVSQLVHKLDLCSSSSASDWQDMRYLVSVNAMTERPTLRPSAASPWMNFLIHWQDTYGVRIPHVEANLLEQRIEDIATNRVNGVTNVESVAFAEYELTPAGHKIAVHLASRLIGTVLDS